MDRADTKAIDWNSMEEFSAAIYVGKATGMGGLHRTNTFYLSTSNKRTFLFLNEMRKAGCLGIDNKTPHSCTVQWSGQFERLLIVFVNDGNVLVAAYHSH